MSENNLFQEVQEDLDRQRYQQMWDRYGPLLIVAAVLIIGGTIAYSTWTSWKSEKNQKASAAYIDIMKQDEQNPDKQIAALQDFASKNPTTFQAVLARFTAASLDEASGKKEQAVAAYDALAKDATLEPVFRQFADLMWIQLEIDETDPALIEPRLAPLAGDAAPWHFSAMELQGYLAMKTGDKEKARHIFTSISQDASAPKTMSARASDMVRYLAQ